MRFHDLDGKRRGLQPQRGSQSDRMEDRPREPDSRCHDGKDRRDAGLAREASDRFESDRRAGGEDERRRRDPDPHPGHERLLAGLERPLELA